MSKRVDAVYLSDMLAYARRILDRVGSRDREAFQRDVALQESVVLNIIFIGEAATKVTAQTRAAHPEIAWTDITDMRNRLVHGYFDIDFSKVWTTVSDDIPKLIAALEPLAR